MDELGEISQETKDDIKEIFIELIEKYPSKFQSFSNLNVVIN